MRNGLQNIEVKELIMMYNVCPNCYSVMGQPNEEHLELFNGMVQCRIILYIGTERNRVIISRPQSLFNKELKEKEN